MGQSLIATMAAQRGMDPVQFARTIRATVMPSDHTEEQFAAFMLVAHKYGLDPITKEIYAYPARKGGGINPVLSVDGWINLVNSHPQSDGFEITFQEDKDGKLVSATCTMWRRDRNHPIVVTESFAECFRNTEPWNQMPRRMLRHKAFKECARLCFGFAGIQDEDEARDISRSVDKLQREIPAATIKALDDFAADSVDVVEQVVAGDRPETAGATGSGEAPTIPQPPSAAATQQFRDSVKAGEDKAEAIAKILALAADSDLDEQERLESLDQVHPLYEDILDADFCRELFRIGTLVARGGMKADTARNRLEKL